MPQLPQSWGQFDNEFRDAKQKLAQAYMPALLESLHDRCSGVLRPKGGFYCTHFHRKVTEVYSDSAGMYGKHYSEPNLASQQVLVKEAYARLHFQTITNVKEVCCDFLLCVGVCKLYCESKYFIFLLMEGSFPMFLFTYVCS